MIRKTDGSVWLSYVDIEGVRREIPITLIGLGDLLGSRVTLSGLKANLIEPKDINRLITSLYPGGNVLYQDDFEASKVSNFYREGDTGYTVQITSTEASLRGSKCMEFFPALGDNKYVRWGILTSIPPSRRIGLELWWRTSRNYLDWNYLKFIAFWLVLYEEGETGETQEWVANLRFTPIKTDNYVYKGVWSYADKNGNYQPLGTQYLSEAQLLWNHLKLVVDFASQKYVSFHSAGRSFNIKDIPVWNYGRVGTDANMLMSLVSLVGNNAANAPYGYVDDFIVTMDEP